MSATGKADLSGVTDYAVVANEGFSTTLSSNITGASTTIVPAATTGYNDGDKVFWYLDAGESTEEVVYGEISSGQLINCVRGILGSAQAHTSGATIVDYPSPAHIEAQKLRQDAEHNATGTHKIASNLDSNGNEVTSYTGVASAVNEITFENAVTTEAPEIQATGDDTNIDLDLVPKGTGEVTKAGNPIDWWEELGRTTLGSAGDTITVSSLPARTYLRLLINIIDSGAVNIRVYFNGDTGSNYAYSQSSNGGASSTATSASNIVLATGSSSTDGYVVADIVNPASREKLLVSLGVRSGTVGAANAPNQSEITGKWANTSDQISSISIFNDSSGDYASGSEVVVLGHD